MEGASSRVFERVWPSQQQILNSLKPQSFQAVNPRVSQENHEYQRTQCPRHVRNPCIIQELRFLSLQVRKQNRVLARSFKFISSYIRGKMAICF